MKLASAIVSALVLASTLSAQEFDPAHIIWGSNGNYKALYAMPDAQLADYKDYIVADINPAAPEWALGIFLEARLKNSGRAAMGVSDDYAVRSLVSTDVLLAANVGLLKAQIAKRATKLVRLALHQQGKSFLTQKDGSNPMEPLIRPILTALDAPACDGLVAALAAVGWTVDTTGLQPMPSGAARQAAIADCERRIVSADNPAPADLGLLLKLLGTDGFNRWVRVYNGEPAK